MEQFKSFLYEVSRVLAMPSIPDDPTAAAPQAVKDRVDTLLGFIKWGSMVAVVGGLLAFGMLTVAAERGGYGSGASEMKERFGKLLVGGIVTGSAVAIATFVFG
ncbi:MAG: hypothetical protein ABMA25_11495 [Ilumatobacteraceae bacterium]